MSIIDRQRIAAVRRMEALGYTFDGFDRHAPQMDAEKPTSANSLQADADAVHALFVLRADKLDGCAEGSDEEAEFKMIAETVTGCGFALDRSSTSGDIVT